MKRPNISALRLGPCFRGISCFQVGLRGNTHRRNRVAQRFDTNGLCTVPGPVPRLQQSEPIRSRSCNILWSSFVEPSSLPSPSMLPSMLPSVLLSTDSTTTFEPVLSIPALIVFVFIGTIFVALQWRVSAIETAVADRTTALRRARELSTKSLGDPTAVPFDKVHAAIEDYRQAYTRVEELRTVIPGVARIVPPPSQTNTRRVKEENERAAQQFLGIAPESEATLDRPNSASETNDGKLTSPLLLVVLLLVGISQIALLSLLTLSDPMAAVSDGTLIKTLTGLE